MLTNRFFVFAAGVHLAVNQLPVITLFLFVPAERHSPAVILDGYNAVVGNGDIYKLTVPLT